MPVIFRNNTGRVTAVEDKVAAGVIQLGNVTGSPNRMGSSGHISYYSHNTIITRLGISAAGNFQFLHTVGNDVYVYVFGDRMGQVQLHGLSFQPSELECRFRTPFSPNVSPRLIGAGGNKHGFELLFEWYAINRIAARKGPVKVTIGSGTTFKGFVTALTGDVQDALHRTIQFQMTISLLPDASI